MKQPIHNTFGPMATGSQVWRSWNLHWQPWRWKTGPETETLRKALQNKFNKQCALFSSGREALLAGLQSLNIGSGDEVILQAYTCAVVTNSITATGAVPIYCDINPKTLNIDPSALKSAISKNTKAIIVQHTFGIPAELKTIQDICKENNIILIEDCAHCIPTAHEAKTIGQFGDVILLSFGRDKAISGVTGGAILASNEAMYAKLQKKEETAYHKASWQINLLLDYPIRYAIAKKIWPLYLGKLYLKILAIFKLLPSIYTTAERKGAMGKTLYKLPNACAYLALYQWYKLGAINAHRRRIAKIYESQLQTAAVTKLTNSESSTALQKFPILIHNRDAILALLKKSNIHLQDGWCGAVVNPPSLDASTFQYVVGSCKQAEKIAEKILTLPLHPTMSESQAVRLCNKLKEALANQGYN